MNLKNRVALIALMIGNLAYGQLNILPIEETGLNSNLMHFAICSHIDYQIGKTVQSGFDSYNKNGEQLTSEKYTELGDLSNQRKCHCDRNPNLTATDRVELLITDPTSSCIEYVSHNSSEFHDLLMGKNAPNSTSYAQILDRAYRPDQTLNFLYSFNSNPDLKGKHSFLIDPTGAIYYKTTELQFMFAEDSLLPSDFTHKAWALEFDTQTQTLKLVAEYEIQQYNVKGVFTWDFENARWRQDYLCREYTLHEEGFKPDTDCLANTNTNTIQPIEIDLSTANRDDYKEVANQLEQDFAANGDTAAASLMGLIGDLIDLSKEDTNETNP